MKNKKIRVAVIGVGNMGRHHVRNYSMISGVELVAIADINPSSLNLAKEYKTNFYKDYKEMIEKEKPDAVSIVVPTPYHYEVGSYIINKGIHCLVEKPIAYSVDEADDLIKLANQKKVVFTVGHIERYNPLIRAIKKIVEEGKLGKITSIVCQRVGGFPKVEPKTDVIIDLAVHDIDIVNYLIGRYPTDIYSHTSRTHHSIKIDSAEILMDYKGVSGFIRANWLTPVKLRNISITGSNGYLEGNYITQELIFYEHNMRKVKNSQFSNFVIEYGDPKKDVIAVKFEEPLAVELKSFLSHIRHEQSLPLVDPVDAKEALKISLIALENNNKTSRAII